ncbi:Inner membrane transport protein YajR [Burkholderiales bacterium]|nr:Inner membrane transport protein YajR [Burkholderiales bacterium]
MPRSAADSRPPSRMTPAERRSTAFLAGVSGLRMLGLFIVLPVLALHAESLPGGHDTAMIGFALGAYGLAQAILQIPFGWASDRVGRKPAIAFGLAVFAAGSFLAAWAPDILWLVAGRTLQGAGAVSAVVMALAADLTRDEVRTRAMAMIGITIGATFALSLVAGPVLAGAIGVPGIFVLTGALAAAAIAVVRFGVPAPPARAHADPRVGFRRVLADAQLLRLDFGIFALHAILTALFVHVPFALRDAGIAPARHWTVYLPVLAVSVAVVLPLFRVVDRPGRGRAVLGATIATLAVSLVILAASGGSLPMIVAGLAVFFCAFNLLEASLPAMVSRFAPRATRGTAIGVFSGMQYLGMFVGATGAGVLLKLAGPAAVYGFGAALAVLWLVAVATMANPPAPAESTFSMGRT